MSLSIYILTDLGREVAASPHNEENDAYKVIYYLARAGRATPQQISQQTGVGFATIGMLARRNIIMDVTNGSKIPA